jgi:hypothetical protein
MIDLKLAETIKPSRYNFIFPLSELAGSILLYNSRTNALLRVSGEAADVVGNIIGKPDKIESSCKNLTEELLGA